MSMTTLPRDLPSGLTKEQPGNNLASLSMTPPMKVIVDTVLRQWRSPQAFQPLARYEIFPVRQLLFYGPPGNGKTCACQWIAQKLDVPLYRVRCETLIEAFMGRTAANVGAILDWLQDSPPAVLLFDEVESLFPARGGASSCARETDSAMAVYWQRLDRWRGRHLFVMATNRPGDLDAALKSRIELHLEFGPPTDQQAREVIAYWSEVLHEYGAESWRQILEDRLDEGVGFASFRDLWHTIQGFVVQHVNDGLGSTDD
ncbi:ATP-binding protein [Crateriforma conspicua]|uniref:ATP-dependent zinc metalloprotease FtsH n=1 Tax=Crateriforma conspicua TaxID=2527996 RepID=A0A5C6FYU2_9PLAN|nr:ATP-binding protein [Crateriforma conspicua]TWU66470.1 ATP-dependent zinc metalloprotease FtsH [Crateriforma conspicua]